MEEFKKKLRKVHEYLVVYITPEEAEKAKLKYGDEILIKKYI